MGAAAKAASVTFGSLKLLKAFRRRRLLGAAKLQNMNEMNIKFGGNTNAKIKI